MGRRQSVLPAAEVPEGRTVGLRACVIVSTLTGEGNRDIPAVDASSKPRPVGDGAAPKLPLGGRVKDVSANDAGGGTTFLINAWNAGESQSASRKRANPSHAERQLIAYLDGRARTDSAFFKSITDFTTYTSHAKC